MCVRACMCELFRHYLVNGVNNYVYWNMVLEEGGESTWGWRQNSMVTIEPGTGAVTYQPEFYLVKHFAHFVKLGAVRLGVKGPWAGTSVCFRNPSGEVVVVVWA